MLQHLYPLLALCQPTSTDSVTLGRGWGSRWEVVAPSSDVNDGLVRRVVWATPFDQRRRYALSCASRRTNQADLVPVPPVATWCQAILYRQNGTWRLDSATCW